MTEWLALLSWLWDHPNYGWVLILAYLIFEVRSKRGRIYSLEKKIVGSITVIRALARVHEEVDTDRVDEYLVENGAEPSDFIVADDDEDDRDNDRLLRGAK